MNSLELKFAADANEAIEVSIKRHGYNPTGIKGMIQRREAEGGSVVDAAIDLIHGGDVQSGFTRMWEISQQPGCGDAYKLTLEWLVSRPENESIFSEETIVLAKKRLYDYFRVE